MHSRLKRIRSHRRLRRLVLLQRFHREEDGIHLAEVAIVLPIFLLMFAATAEFGRLFYEYTTLAKAARVGARYLITAQVIPIEDTRAKNIVVYGNPDGTGEPILKGLSTTNVKITREGGYAILPETVEVKIDGYQYQPIFDLGAMMNSQSLSLNVPVRPSVKMRYLMTQPPPIE